MFEVGDVLNSGSFFKDLAHHPDCDDFEVVSVEGSCILIFSPTWESVGAGHDGDGNNGPCGHWYLYSYSFEEFTQVNDDTSLEDWI
jgi:hypothetical protein